LRNLKLNLTFACRAYNRATAGGAKEGAQLEETFPDVSSMSNQELKELISQLTDDERQVSYQRRLLHGKIDILRAELVNRLKAKREGGDSLITGDDVQQLTDILLGQVSSPEGGREE
jgi:RsiG-like